MLRKTLSVGIGFVLISSPFLAFAQTVQTTTSLNTSLIAALTQLVQILEQELQLLTESQSQTSGIQSTPQPTIVVTSAATQAQDTGQSSVQIDQALSTIQAVPDTSVSGNYLMIPGFSGTAANVSSVYVVAIYGSYTGARDFSSASHLGQVPASMLFPHVNVANGRWTTRGIDFSDQPPSELTLLVYDDSSPGSPSAGQFPLAITTVHID